jgi:hypothetical protein
VMSKLGSGSNSFTNRMLGVGGCVNGTFIPPQAAGSSPTYQLDVVTSYEQFTQSTSVASSLYALNSRVNNSVYRTTSPPELALEAIMILALLCSPPINCCAIARGICLPLINTQYCALL